VEISRRDLIKLGLFSSAALMLPAERAARTALADAGRIPTSRLPQPFTVPFAAPPVAVPIRSTADTDYYAMTLRAASVEILPGLKSTIWGYEGVTPGPTIVARRGRPIVVRHTNRLPAFHPTLRYVPWTSTHLHGSASLPEYDGYASDVTQPGQYKDYHYPNIQDARTLWYHDHGIHHTASNVAMGLVAQYHVHDDVELGLPIPHGRYDVPLIVQDQLFQSNGELLWDDHSESGFYGDVVLVNGRPWPAMKVERRKYRFRILNASVSRSYEWALDTGDPFTVIGTDAGLMPAPQQTTSFRHGMAERYEVVIDFSRYRAGQRVVLKNLMPPNNIDYDTVANVMAFDVVGDATDLSNNSVPDVLNPNHDVMGLQASDAKTTRRFVFERKGGEWTINGETWAQVIDSGYTHVVANPGAGDVEIWELQNKGGGWFHPVHIHLVDGKMLDRNGQPPMPHERGGKDVYYVGENETVRTIMRFTPQVGRYMMHCHNLAHEDHDMMVQFEVGTGGHDPISASRARALPAPLL
jgi:FtsP/CotA-like multicopper oxidase with cupredoxin domain